MNKLVKIAFLTVVLCAATAFAAEQEFLIASWENTLDKFATGASFDSVAFTTFDGVTNGSTALELDIKPNWQFGLESGFGNDWSPVGFYPQLADATKLRLDVTTSNSLVNLSYASGVIMAVYFQGEAPGVPFYSYTTIYKAVDAVYNPDINTCLMEWDVPTDLPDFTGGWFDMKIHFSTLGGANPGIVIVDNLRSVKQASQLAIEGDFTGNGIVDQADYTNWADHFGWTGDVANNPLLDERGAVSWPGNNIVDQADYTRWADNFGHTGTPVVPEPATMTLLGLGAFALLRRK